MDLESAVANFIEISKLNGKFVRFPAEFERFPAIKAVASAPLTKQTSPLKAIAKAAVISEAVEPCAPRKRKQELLKTAVVVAKRAKTDECKKRTSPSTIIVYNMYNG